jgi:7-cyano-7-deazaguanine tRNA-ribosyltransferase
LQALKRLKKYEDFIEKHSPTTKKSGLFYFGNVGLSRPEVMRHRKKLAERYTPPKEAETLLLMPQTRNKPFHKAQEYKQAAKLRNKEPEEKVHVCFYAAPFGVVPIELDEVYPLSQHETVLPLDKETIEYVANQITNYINQSKYKTIMLLDDPENWNKTILNTCKKLCKQKHIKLKTINTKNQTRTPKFNL